MKRAALVGIVFAAIGAGLLLPSLSARQYDVGARFEYLRLTPGLPLPAHLNGQVIDPSKLPRGYQACLAKPADWECRQFGAPTSDEALRRALTTLGAERWELVSVIEQSPNVGWPEGMTYLFKRQLR
jgi:hypothetical protein